MSLYRKELKSWRLNETFVEMTCLNSEYGTFAPQPESERAREGRGGRGGEAFTVQVSGLGFGVSGKARLKYDRANMN